MKKRLSVFLVGCLTVILIIGVAILSGCNNSATSSLDEKEMATYNMLIEASLQFKDPSSVRILSGQVDYYDVDDYRELYGEDFEERYESVWSDADKERGYLYYAYLRISATNGFGTTTSENYFISYGEDGDLNIWNLSEYPSLFGDDDCYITDDFNYAAVNAALADYWENLLG